MGRCLDWEWNENEWKIPLHTNHGVVFFSIHELPGEAVKGVWELADFTDTCHHICLFVTVPLLEDCEDNMMSHKASE
jgi:hypothetical protein